MNKRPYSAIILSIVCMLACLWASSLWAQENMVFHPGAGFVNVMNHGAVGDGVADDTQAIRNAINTASSGVARVVYLPNGTYKVSGTINWTTPYERYLTLQGQSKSGTIIKLVDNAANYQSAASPKAVLSTLRSSSNLFDSFRNYIRNLTVDVGQGNSGAVGIDYLSHNSGGIYDVNIRSSDAAFIGHTGLRMPMAGPGPSFIKNVQIIGFDTGIRATDSHVCVTFEHINLSDQRVRAIRNDKNSLTFRDLVSQNSVPVIESTDERGFIQVINGTFNGGLGSSTAITSPLGMVHLRDVVVSGYGNAVSDEKGVLPSGTITEYLTHRFRSGRGPVVMGSMRLPIVETPDVLWDATTNWTRVTSYGAVQGDSGKQPFVGNWTNAGDDSAGIQAAIDSGKTTVCFPKGVYIINNTIYIRGNVRRLIGLDSTLQAGATLASSGAPMFVFENGTSPVVVFERFDADYGGITGPFMLHNSTRTLVLKGVTAVGSPANGYYNYKTGTGTGDLFVEDSVIRISIKNQNAWMRQYNSETVSQDQITPHLINDGGTVFVLGMKTEGVATQIETKNGGRTEVLGGLLASTGYVQPDLPGIINRESQVCVVAPTYIDPAAQQERVLSETIGGFNRILRRADFPNRSSSEYQVWNGLFAPAGNFYAYGGGYAVPSDGTYFAVPGTVEAENFALMSGIQTVSSSEGPSVGFIDSGDWMEYGINPAAASAYTVELRVASLSAGGTVRIMSGSTVLATVTIPVTGGWDTWTTVSSTLNLAAGQQYIWLDVVSGGWNFNRMKFTGHLQWGASGAGGSGTWDANITTNWFNGASDVTWPAPGGNADTAIFSGTPGTVTLSGAIIANRLLFNTTGYTLQSGTLTLNGAAPTLTTASGVSASISSIVAGSVGLVKTGTGTAVLSGANSYTGVTEVNGGILDAAGFSNYGSPGSLGTRSSDAAGNVGIVLRGGTLRYSGGSAQTTNRAIRISSTNGGGAIDASGSSPTAILSFTAASSPDFTGGGGNRTLTLTGSNTGQNTFGMAITESGAVTSLVKSGPGTWRLTGANTLTGPTTIEAGTLAVNGSHTGSITVASGATLAGNGTISATTTVNGLHAPGGSAVAILTHSGAINYGATSRLGWQLNTHVNSGGSGTAYDRVTAATVTVNAGAAIDLAFNAPGSAVNFTDTFWDVSRSWNVINHTSRTGAFALGTVSTDAGGRASNLNGRFSLTHSASAVALTWTPGTPLENWRDQYFGTTANTGTAADTFDADSDGETNLLEFATGQNPNATTLTQPALVQNGVMLELTYTRSNAALVDGVTFAVEWSDTLAAGSWSSAGVTEQILSDNGTVQSVRASVPTGPFRRFLHLKISKP